MSQASYLDFTGLSNGTSGISLEGKLQGTVLNADKIFADEQAKAFTGSKIQRKSKGVSIN